MIYRLSFLLFLLVYSHLCSAQEIDFSPKSLQKDLQKIWAQGEIELGEVEIPDSMYNDHLLNKGKIYNTNANNTRLGFAYVGRIYSCRAGGCGIEDTQSLVADDEDYEYFDYYIIYNENVSVELVRVYNYQATHGQEVGGKGWLKQFIGYTGTAKLEYGKNIDSISGATISANAITYNVQESTEYLTLLLPIINATQMHLKTTATK